MVSVRGLVKRYDSSAPAVRGVTFDIARGEILTLLGPSGCGKTTIMRCVAGFEQVSEGEIHIDGKLVSDGKRGTIIPVEQRGIGFVHQSYALWPHMTVSDTLAFGLQSRRVRAPEIERMVNETLATVKLEGLAQRLPSQLSGGQQQRVALGRSLVYNPAVILLDEPLSNLDAKLREYTRDELRRLFKRLGSTVLYVTHDQAEAMAISDTCMVLKDGLVQQAGAPVDLYTRPSNAFVAEFMGSSNLFAGSLSGPNLFRTDWAELRVDATENVGPVGKICIRPKDIALSREQTGPNSIEVKVLLKTFIGECVKYQVAPLRDPKSELFVHVYNFDQVDVDEGEHVYVTIPERACVLLSGE